MQQDESQENLLTDPNASKFIPGAVHYERSKHSNTQSFVDLVNYNSFLKDEDQFGVVFEDYTFESNQTQMIDWAFATGCAYINLKGFNRPERSSKVDRFQEILETIRSHAVETDSPIVASRLSSRQSQK